MAFEDRRDRRSDFHVCRAPWRIAARPKDWTPAVTRGAAGWMRYHGGQPGGVIAILCFQRVHPLHLVEEVESGEQGGIVQSTILK